LLGVLGHDRRAANARVQIHMETIPVSCFSISAEAYQPPNRGLQSVLATVVATTSHAQLQTNDSIRFPAFPFDPIGSTNEIQSSLCAFGFSHFRTCGSQRCMCLRGGNELVSSFKFVIFHCLDSHHSTPCPTIWLVESTTHHNWVTVRRNTVEPRSFKEITGTFSASEDHSGG
jgi:hypothetical protein